MITTSWSFTVPGVPVAKGRPRVTIRGGRPRAYTPEKTEKYENLVRLAFIEKYGETVPASGPITIEIDAFFPIPKSFSKNKRQRALLGLIQKTTKPDLDNVQKAILDGLNGVAFADDSQIYEIHARKAFSTTPRADIVITEELEEEA